MGLRHDEVMRIAALLFFNCDHFFFRRSFETSRASEHLCQLLLLIVVIILRGMR